MIKTKQKILINKTRRGDRDAFEKIYDEYINRIYRFIFFKVLDEQQAQDLTQDVFLGLLNSIKNSNSSIDNLQAFLYKIARNTVAEFYSSKNFELGRQLVEQEVGEMEFKLKDDKQDVAEMFDKNLSIEVVKRAIDQIDNQEYREVIYLRYLDELSHKEIADILQKEEGAVRVQLHRAIKFLKKIIEEDFVNKNN